MTGTAAKPQFPTQRTTIELDRHGGGFIALDLVAPAELRLSSASTRLAGTRFVATVAYVAENLPGREIDCAVKWSVASHAKSDKVPATVDVAASSVKIKAGTGTVEVTLDLMTAGKGLGPFLEAGGGDLTLSMHPDYPHVLDGSLVLSFHHALALRLLAHEMAPPKAAKKDVLASVSAAEPEPVTLGRAGALIPRIGEIVRVTLDRSQWPCHVRLRVDTPESDVTVVYAPGEAGDKPWRFGCSGTQALVFPKPREGKLGFSLLLEVSESGKDDEWATVHAGWLSVAEPTLSAFAIEKKEDGHVVATGTLTGFAPGFSPPFSVQLWAISTPTVAGAPRALHPVSELRTSVGGLDGDGSFEAGVPSPGKEDLAKLTLFGVLRAPGTEGKLTPIGSFLRFGTLRAFSDEDLLDKGVALGVCSQEITAKTNASRTPVALGVSIEVVLASITAHVDVLGPASYWNRIKPKVGFRRTGATEDQVTVAARYAAVPGGAHGVLTGGLPIKELGALAGGSVTVRLVVDKDAPHGIEGAHVAFDATPRIGPITWQRDKDSKKKDQIHFVCKTRMFPEMSEVLVASITGPDGTPIAAKLVYEHASPPGGQADDQGLEFFIRDPALLGAVTGQLEAHQLEVRVEPPSGKPTLYDNPDLPVASVRM